MTTIGERKQQLKRKLKKMVGDNTMMKPVMVPSPFDPSEGIKSSPTILQEEGEGPEETKPTNKKLAGETEGRATGNIEPKGERKSKMERSGRSSLPVKGYRSLYFHPIRSQVRTAFSINLETLQSLCNVLQDLREHVSIAVYIDNILREYLREHLELLNSATAK